MCSTAAYHWREMPQVSFLSWQNFCHDKITFVATEYFCHDKTFVMTYICHDKSFVATKDVFFCDKHMFVMTKMIHVAAPTNDSNGQFNTALQCYASHCTYVCFAQLEICFCFFSTFMSPSVLELLHTCSIKPLPAPWQYSAVCVAFILLLKPVVCVRSFTGGLVYIFPKNRTK